MPETIQTTVEQSIAIDTAFMEGTLDAWWRKYRREQIDGFLTGSETSETNSSHVPDKPEDLRTRLLKRIEDSALTEPIGFDALMLDKIGRQINRVHEQQETMLRNAGELEPAQEGEEMPWAGTSVGNEYHYHYNDPSQQGKNGQQQPQPEPPPKPPPEPPAQPVQPVLQVQPVPPTRPDPSIYDQKPATPSLASRLGPAALLGTGLAVGLGGLGYGVSKMEPDVTNTNITQAPATPHTLDTDRVSTLKPDR